MPDLLGFTFRLLAVFLASFCFDGVCCFVTAPGWQRAVAIGLGVLWEDEV
jgi:hypothetical protein